jgi:hypothetical protein
MGEDSEQIALEIRAERQELGRNLSELERKAEQLTDWRTHYRNNPKLLLGIALGSGLVLGALSVRGRAPRDPYEAQEMAARPSRALGRASRQVDDTLQSIADGLLGVASATVIELVSSVVPGFREQLHSRQPGAGNGQFGTR